jgi:hypothetical protein
MTHVNKVIFSNSADAQVSGVQYLENQSLVSDRLLPSLGSSRPFVLSIHAYA